MKSLLDIQQDIRNLEKSVNDITHSIKDINSDIEDLRTVKQNTDVDYSKIEVLARQISFGKHPLDKLEDGEACRIYLEMLLNIVRLDLDEEVSLNRLVFINWLQMESRIDWSLEELFNDCYRIEADSYHELIGTLSAKYKEFFIVDALIIANLGGSANAEIYEYIADLVAILNIDKERLRILSLTACVALCQSVKHMKKKEIDEFLICAKAFNHYIKADIFEDGIKTMRHIIVQLPDNPIYNLEWKVKKKQKVKKDEVVAIYMKPSIHFRREEIKSPSAGIIFYFLDNGIHYGVLAHEADNETSIKAWIKQGGK